MKIQNSSASFDYDKFPLIMRRLTTFCILPAADQSNRSSSLNHKRRKKIGLNWPDFDFKAAALRTQLLAGQLFMAKKSRTNRQRIARRRRRRLQIFIRTSEPFLFLYRRGLSHKFSSLCWQLYRIYVYRLRNLSNIQKLWLIKPFANG